MTKEEEFYLLKDLALSEAGKLLLQDIKANRDSTDTLLGHNSTNDMLVSTGYVQGLDWIAGLLEYYQSRVWSEEEGNIDAL